MSENNKNIDVNKINEEKYNEILEKGEKNKDFYYDRNNFFIRILLCVILAVAICSVIVYIFWWYTSK